MRFNYALATLISFSVIFFINLDSTYSQDLVGEEDPDIIVVDSVERYDSYPEVLKRAPRPGYTTTYKSPKRRNDFVAIFYTVVEELKEFKYSKSILIDDGEKTCTEWVHSLKSVYGGTDTIKPTGIILYEMSKEAIPAHLKYFYQYGDEVKESQETKIGQQNIDLLHIQ